MVTQLLHINSVSHLIHVINSKIELIIIFTTVGHFISEPLNYMCVCVCVCVCMCVCERERAQSCLTLCNPMDCSPPGTSVYGIFQARVLKQVAISFFRDLPNPRIKPTSLKTPALAGGFSTTITTWEANTFLTLSQERKTQASPQRVKSPAQVT